MAETRVHVYPRDAASRMERREEIRSIALIAAEQRAARVGLSMKCAGEGMAVQHKATPGGCANDGSTCLCECHDGLSGGTPEPTDG